MRSDTFIQGLSRVLNCSKVQVTATGLVTTWFAVRYAAADLPPTQRASLWVAFIGAVAVQLREIINAWSEEDVARVRVPRDGSTHVSNVVAQQPISTSAEMSQTADADSSVSASLSDGSDFTDPPQNHIPFTTRSPDMPPRTKLPAVLIGFSFITLVAGSGCQTPPQLATYREGLYRVDEPLYEAHLLLMDDAVKANIRTDADRQVVQQGITAARGLYQQSQALDTGAAPTTAP
ncbi:MAG TPA: hypothetical protein VG326_08495 [Tepidisphaeraceae bacterium]|jgi:hypothetical protein|nr:hypothetical protein [Tepidisphaeraceae bacterium]